MKKEEILEMSRKENKKKDFATIIWGLITIPLTIIYIKGIFAGAI